MAQTEKLSGRPPAAVSYSETSSLERGLRYGKSSYGNCGRSGVHGRRSDDTGLASALPANDAEEVVLEKLTKNNVNAVDADAPRADVIVDLVHGIESLTKDDARARLLELEDDQEKTFFEIGGVLSAIQKLNGSSHLVHSTGGLRKTPPSAQRGAADLRP